MNNLFAKVVRGILTSVLLVGMFSSCVTKSNNNKKNDEKEAILLVTFGSSYKRPEATFQNIEKNFREAYPKTDIYWAFTSKMIRKILNKRGEGPFKNIQSSKEMLLNLKAKGYNKIALQSLHVIPGTEYNDLKEIVADFQKQNPNIKITLGTPLMNTDKDMQALADIIVKMFDAKDRTVIMMGHGTVHEANDRYTRIDKIFKKTNPNFIVGTVEAAPGIDEVVVAAKALSSKNILLMPLMSVAGDHATNDMAGDEEDSWKTVLEKEGFNVTSELQGLCDYDEVVTIFIDHFKASMK